jgi:3D (Asp-Asp-Asp) domain-containing protein
MYTPVTVTANFSSNVINVTTTSNLTLVKGGSMTAHYYGSGEYGNGSGSTSSGSLSNGSCSSITGYILAQIGNVNVIPGNISFDITFLDGFAQTPTGPEEVTCTCLYDGCVVNVGPINVTPPTLSLRVGGDPITLTPPQVTPIYITLNGPTSTVTLSVSPSGSASLDRTSLTIAANQTATVNLTPLAASQAIDDVQISASIPEVPAATANTTILGLTPARQSMTTLSGTASPPGGTFSNYAGYLSGNSSQLPQVALANGVNAQTNPTSVVLSNPTNECSGSPCPGAESQIELTYALPPANDFVLPASVTAGSYVATFGTSCYRTALQADWGSAPNSCGKTNIPILGGVFQGVAGTVATQDEPIPVPSWLPPGSYCEAFLADFKLQGSAYLNDGSLWLWSANTHQLTSGNLIGHDGTPVVAGQTVARDLNIIPTGGVLVDLNLPGVANGLLANDSGGAIQAYRLDRFMGSGVAACSGTNGSNLVSIGACRPGNYYCPPSSAVNGQQ